MRRFRVHAALAWGLGALLAAVPGVTRISHGASDSPPGMLVIEITGIPSAGTLHLELYDAGGQERWGTPLRRGRLEAGPSSSEWRVPGLAAGEYAVRVFLDQNANGILDLTRNGVPREPFGFSNDARPRLGPPRLRAAAFAFDSAEQRIAIRLRSRGAEPKADAAPAASEPDSKPD